MAERLNAPVSKTGNPKIAARALNHAVDAASVDLYGNEDDEEIRRPAYVEDSLEEVDWTAAHGGVS